MTALALRWWRAVTSTATQDVEQLGRVLEAGEGARRPPSVACGGVELRDAPAVGTQQVALSRPTGVLAWRSGRRWAGHGAVGNAGGRHQRCRASAGFMRTMCSPASARCRRWRCPGMASPSTRTRSSSVRSSLYMTMSTGRPDLEAGGADAQRRPSVVGQNAPGCGSCAPLAVGQDRAVARARGLGPCPAPSRSLPTACVCS